jgi:predicted ATPase
MLSDETNVLLSIASVIGNQFQTQLLAQVSGSANEGIIELMEGALRAGILIEPSGGGLHYRFSHAFLVRLRKNGSTAPFCSGV